MPPTRTVSRYKACALIALLLLVAAPALAWPRRASSDPLDNPALPAGTPWAIPLAGGPLRVLLLAPAATLRDAVELRQRLQSDVTAEPLPDPAVPDDAAEARLRKALDRHWDVIALGRCHPDALPLDLQERLVALAASGTGVVFSYLDVTETPLSERGPLARWLGDQTYTVNTDTIVSGVMRGPGWSGPLETVQAAESGQSRIVWLDYAGDVPQSQSLIPPPASPLEAFPGDWENAWSLVVRALRWAAHREPALRIADIVTNAPSRPDAEEIPPDLPEEFVDAVTTGSYTGQPVRNFRIVLNQPADRNYAVRLRLRRLGAPMLTDTTIAPRDKIAKGAAGYPVQLLAGPGPYWVDAWILDDGRVVDWFTQELDFDGWPTFSGLDCDKTFLLPNDTLDFTLQVPPIYNQERQCTVYARATDALGRVVAQQAQSLSAEGGEAALRLRFADLRSTLVRVEIFAVEGPARPFSEMELLAAYRDVRHFAVRMPMDVTRPSLVIAAPAPGEWNTGMQLTALQQAGFGAVLAPAGEAAVVQVPQARMRLITAVGGPPLDGWLAPCGLEPIRLQHAAENVKQEVLRVWAGGSGIYCLEAGMPAESAGADCAEALGAFLQSRYNTRDALQDTWQRPFDSWDAAATALLHGQVPGEAAAADRIDFQRNRLTQQAAALRDAIRSVDREAQVGVCPGPNAPAPLVDDSFAALDFRVLPGDLPVPPQTGTPYQAADLSDAVRQPPAAVQRMAWSALFHQQSALWLTHPDTPATTPDGHVAPWVRPISLWMRAVDQGTGALLLQAAPVQPTLDPEAEPAADAETEDAFHYQLGRAEIGAWLPPADANARHIAPRFTLPFVYDVLRGRQVKRPKNLSATLHAGEAAVYAALPYRVEKLVVTAPKSVVAGYRLDFVVQVDAGEATPGTHLLCIDLTPREGTPRLHYRQCLLAEGGVAKGYVPLAFNEIPGKYWLEVRDQLTGKTARHPLRLLPNLETP